MSDEEEECPDCPAGIPAWVMTFADLMSLLMCFFVLLLSFAEMDAMKFKRLAGQLREAFGVQLEIKATDPPKGTSVIAQHFSPAKPEPTPINEVRQKTSDLTKNSLEVLCQDEVTQQEEEQDKVGDQTRVVTIEKIITPQEIEDQALKMAAAMEEEISEGKVEIETQGKKIIIRIQEKGSFRSGSDYLEDRFLPVLDKIREVLEDSPGRISVEGHTDDIPIDTPRFRSNWALSAGRAVAVAHEIFISPKLSEKRFMVVGHADARPLLPNDAPDARARNRRVEIILYRSNEFDDDEVPELDENSPEVKDALDFDANQFDLSPNEIF